MLPMPNVTLKPAMSRESRPVHPKMPLRLGNMLNVLSVTAVVLVMLAFALTVIVSLHQDRLAIRRLAVQVLELSQQVEDLQNAGQLDGFNQDSMDDINFEVKRDLPQRSTEKEVDAVRVKRQAHSEFPVRHKRLQVAAHFHGYTQLMENSGSAYESWLAPKWFDNLDLNKHFTLKNGVVTVKHAGLYYVYAQIYYQTTHDMSGYKVMKNDVSFMRCTVTTYSSRDNTNTCFTAAVEYFTAGDRLSIMDLGGSRTTYHDVDRSFFGLFRIGDSPHKNAH